MTKRYSKIFVYLLILVSGILKSHAQSCHLIWDSYQSAQSSEDAIMYLNKYIDQSCRDSLSLAHYALASKYFNEKTHDHKNTISDQKFLKHLFIIFAN